MFNFQLLILLIGSCTINDTNDIQILKTIVLIRDSLNMKTKDQRRNERKINAIIHLLLSLFMFIVDDEAVTDVDESIVDCVASSAWPLSVLAFDTSIGNCRLDPVFALFASPRH